MLLRPAFIFTAVIIFSMLNGWAFINGLNQNNVWSCLMAAAAMAGTFYFVHIYQKLRTTPPTKPKTKGWTTLRHDERYLLNN